MASWWALDDKHVQHDVYRELCERFAGNPESNVNSWIKTVKDKMRIAASEVFGKIGAARHASLDQVAYLDFVGDFVRDLLNRLTVCSDHVSWVKKIRWGPLLAGCLVLPPSTTAAIVTTRCTQAASDFMMFSPWMNQQQKDSWGPPQSEGPQFARHVPQSAAQAPQPEPQAFPAGFQFQNFRSWGDWDSPPAPASQAPTTCPGTSSSGTGPAEWYSQASGSTQQPPPPPPPTAPPTAPSAPPWSSSTVPPPCGVPLPPKSWGEHAPSPAGPPPRPPSQARFAPPIQEPWAGQLPQVTPLPPGGHQPPLEGSLQRFMWECIEGLDANPAESNVLQKRFLEMWPADRQFTDYGPGFEEVSDAHRAVIDYLRGAGIRLQMRAARE